MNSSTFMSRSRSTISKGRAANAKFRVAALPNAKFSASGSMGHRIGMNDASYVIFELGRLVPAFRGQLDRPCFPRFHCGYGRKASAVTDNDSSESLEIDGLKLTYWVDDPGGTHYRGRGHVEEACSPFYRLLGHALEPSHCVDIGANYGFTGLVIRRAFPAAHLTLVEPVPDLCDFIHRNFAANGYSAERIIPALVDRSSRDDATFGLNLRGGSQDNRVVPVNDSWMTITTRATTLDALTADFPADARVYIKIDTQGFEFNVFSGGEGFLSQSDRWIAKTEFAPQWMRSQGSDPQDFLRYLVDRYDVREHPARYAWTTSSLDAALSDPITADTVEPFTAYVEGLNHRRRGWVDLLVRPAAH